jgi:putative acetyltransferase
MPNDRAGAKPAPVTIRAREPGDWQEIADLTSLPNVRFGTLRLPFTSGDHWRRLMEKPGDGVTSIVAVLDARIVGVAGLIQGKGRRSHVAEIFMSVHDDHSGRGIGTALLAALVDAADNWLNIRRLELTVYVDNEPGIRLYKKFGFEIEGTRRADAFRAGKFVDSLMMARLRLDRA